MTSETAAVRDTVRSIDHEPIVDFKCCACCGEKCEFRQPKGYCALSQIGRGSYRIIPFTLEKALNAINFELEQWNLLEKHYTRPQSPITLANFGLDT